MFTQRSNLHRYVIGIIFLMILTACKSQDTPTKVDNLQTTIDSQQLKIDVLETQIAAQIEANQTQWEAISHLSTQMPFAPDLITPILENITSTPTPWRDIEYPPDTRTGIEEIDHVIDVFFDTNLEERTELIHYIQYPCTLADGLGGPPKCEGDETEGTIVAAFPVLYSEGVHVRSETIQSVVDFTIRGLYAVYEVPDDVYQTEYWPSGKYAVVFTSEEGGHSHIITIHITNGEIIQIEFRMEWPPSNSIWDDSTYFIIPPSLP